MGSGTVRGFGGSLPQVRLHGRGPGGHLVVTRPDGTAAGPRGDSRGGDRVMEGWPSVAERGPGDLGQPGQDEDGEDRAACQLDPPQVVADHGNLGPEPGLELLHV